MRVPYNKLTEIDHADCYKLDSVQDGEALGA